MPLPKKKKVPSFPTEPFIRYRLVEKSTYPFDIRCSIFDIQYLHSCLSLQNSLIPIPCSIFAFLPSAQCHCLKKKKVPSFPTEPFIRYRLVEKSTYPLRYSVFNIRYSIFAFLPFTSQFVNRHSLFGIRIFSQGPRA